MDPEPFPISKDITNLVPIAILWRGDEAERRSATPHNRRFKGVFARLDELDDHGEGPVG
jgi:hypothetical protein